MAKIWLNGDATRSPLGPATAVLLAFFVIGLAAACGSEATTADERRETETVSADDALNRLIEGNRRFVDGKPHHPHSLRGWRVALEAEQHPFAVVLGCADSRVPPELVFDQGFGDLFVIRVAGNIVDTDVTASVEYAVDHLDTHLLVVLGHTHCGAVTATLDYASSSAGEPDEIVSLIHRIQPALSGLPQGLSRERQVREGVKRNVQFAVRRLSSVPDLMKGLKKKRLKIVGAVYDLHTGKVQIMKE